MRVVGVKVLKNKLSEYVRLAASGERILVSDRDKVVAELGPPHPGTAENVADARLAEAVRKGWITPPLVIPADPPPSLPIAKLADILGDLEASRSDRS